MCNNNKSKHVVSQCSSDTAARFCFKVNAQSHMNHVHTLPFHHITDLLRMSADYWEDLSIWQACSSQQCTGLMFWWKGHGSSEAIHPIRKEMCHEMKVITQCCLMRWEWPWPLRNDWFNARKLTLNYSSIFTSRFHFSYILCLLLKKPGISFHFFGIADLKRIVQNYFWCNWLPSVFLPVPHFTQAGYWVYIKWSVVWTDNELF